MDATRLTLTLRPIHEGAYTEISLQGPVATVPRIREVQELLSMLWRWHGRPVDVVLCVDGTNKGACWMEVWADALGHVPGRLLEVRFRVLRGPLAMEAGRNG
ncbi:MAG: hypothetical protein ABSB49_22545 [Polyangia bacterium]|jgi:hypothetical protein